MLLQQQQWPLQQQSSCMFASNVAAKAPRLGDLPGVPSNCNRNRNVQQSSRIQALLNAPLFYASQPSALPACPFEQAHQFKPYFEMLGSEIPSARMLGPEI